MQGCGKHSHRLVKHLLALCVAVLSLLTFSGVGFATAAADARPLEGMFDACDLNALLSTCEQRLNVMHAGGIQVVVQNLPNGAVTTDTGPQYLANVTAYATYAKSLGMQIMWELDEPELWSESTSDTTLPAYDLAAFTSSEVCGANCTIGSMTTAMIQWLAALGNTYGFYAADDSAIGNVTVTQLKAYVSRIRAADPGHMVMIGANESDGTDYAPTGATLGAEIYPIVNSTLMPASRYQDIWSYYPDTWIPAFQQASNLEHVGSAYILQAFSWGDNIIDGQAVGLCTANTAPQTCFNRAVYPSSADQLYMRNAVLQHSNASLILWYNFAETYGQAGGDTYNIYPTAAAATAHWTGLQQAMSAPYPLTAQQIAAKHRAAARAKARAIARRRAAARAAAKRRAAARARRLRAR